MNLEVAAMLVTLGFKFRKDRPGCRIEDDKDRKRNLMFFEDACESDDFGRIKAGHALSAWKAAQEGKECKLKADNPAAYQAIEYMAVSAKNRLAILHAWKTEAPIMVEQHIDGNTLHYPAGASPDLIRRVDAMIADS